MRSMTTGGLRCYDDVMTEYTAIVKQSSDGWIGWIEEVPGVNCQEDTREELLATLRITLAEALEPADEWRDRQARDSTTLVTH